MHSQLLHTVVAVSPEKNDDSAPKINLDLRIGRCGEGRLKKRARKIKQEKEESLFTAAQFQEFYNQTAVYNSITLGLPVPFHLLLPIWMSVFNSLGPVIYKDYPSFSGLSPQNTDQSTVMDSEPGRCRRTDGRKWRCSKNVIPCQKYCERHMHRGRQGSRKHVEPIESASRHYNITTVDGNKMPIMSVIAVNRIGLDQNQPCSDYRSGVPANFECKTNENRDDSFAIRTSDDVFSVGNEVKKNTVVDSARSRSSSSKNNFTTNEGNHAEGKSSSDDANPRKIGGKKQDVARNYVGSVCPRFGLSPKSVLHCDAGKVEPGLDSKNVTETEPQRCRRTDGKKWQCRRDAVPNQKYCEAHMHRGAKKLVLNPQSVSGSLATVTRRNVDNGINLNSVPASPQHVTGNNSTSSTSDATTITDENISFCISHSFHNH